jgi:prepilin-type N-terminal cleavage/methylation domain-containing protein
MIEGVRRRLVVESGYTLIELLQVMVILGVVLGALTAVFVSALNSEVDMNRRFQAQQEARLAVDKIRREIHCARVISPAGVSASITVTLPGGCPTAGLSDATVTYSTESIAAYRWELRRNGVRIADFVTAPAVFNYTPQSTDSRARLRLELPINPKPSDAGKTWRLVADIVLRNSSRT